MGFSFTSLLECFRTEPRLGEFVKVYFFATVAVAQIAQKCIVISIHGPYSVVEAILLGPGTFVLDLITLLVLLCGLTSIYRAWKALAVFVGVLIVICSAVSASVYQETSAKVSWGRSLEVFGHKGHPEL